MEHYRNVCPCVAVGMTTRHEVFLYIDAHHQRRGLGGFLTENPMARTHILNDRIQYIMDSLQLSQEEIALAAGASWEVIERWQSNDEIAGGPLHDRLDDLRKLTDLLLDSFESSEAAADWMRSRSGYLGGRQPLDVLKEGHVDQVEGAIQTVLWGIFT